MRIVRRAVLLAALFAGCDEEHGECEARADCEDGHQCFYDEGAGLGRCVVAREAGDPDPALRWFDDPEPRDLVFVIDDGPTMAEPQRRLVESLAPWIDEMALHRMDLRIGVTTAHVGHPACSPQGAEHGRFVTTSCLDRLGDFVAPDGTDHRELCTDRCEHDTAELGLVDAPWIEAAELPPGVTLHDALSCVLPQGVRGCTIGAPLEAIRLVIKRAFTDTEDAFGFIRPFALRVLMVTDGNDCSATNDPPFDTWWLQRDEPLERACWDTGTTCSGDGHPFETCEPAQTEGPLHPLTRYDDLLGGYGDPSIVALAGVPEDASDAVVYSLDGDASFVERHGIAPGCTDDAIAAAPPVRLLEHPADTASICADDYSPVLLSHLGGIGSGMCLPECVGESPFSEIAFEHSDGRVVEVPPCEGDDPHVTVPAGAPACHRSRLNPDACGSQRPREVLLLPADPRAPGAFLLRPILRACP